MKSPPLRCALTVENVTNSAFASVNGVSFIMTFKVVMPVGEVDDLPHAIGVTAVTMSSQAGIRIWDVHACPMHAARQRGLPLHFPAALHRLVHRELVGVLDVGSDGDARRDAGDGDAERLEELREVNRGRLPLDVRVGCEDDFLDAAVADAREQLLDLQIVGPYALER